MSLPKAQKPANYALAIDVVETRQPGMLGINTITDQHDIKDQESPDMLNMYFDNGVIGNRPGYSLFAAKPTGETGTPLQMMIAKTSDGVNYIISIYTSGTITNNFYLWDSTNTRWIPINGSYLPTFTKMTYFGSQNWNYAYGDDRLYFGNKYDSSCRWRNCLNYLSTAAASADTTLTLTDTSRFFVYQAAVTGISSNIFTLSTSPQGSSVYTNSWEKGQMVYFSDPGNTISGLTNGTVYYAVPSSYILPVNGVSGNSLGLATSYANAIAGTVISISGSPSNVTIYKATPVVIYDGTTATQKIYYTKSSTTLTLTGTVGTTIAIGASVSPTIVPVAIPKGNIVVTWQSRFITAGAYQNENTMYLSRVSDPEDYVPVTDDMNAGGFQIFNDGAGGLIDIKEFGTFLVVSKSNAMYQFSFVQNADLSAQFPQITPIVSGIGMGPVTFRSSLKALNAIYYPSGSSGFIQLSPVASGVTASTGLQVISYNINNILPNYDFSNSKGGFYKNKLFWTAQSSVSQNIIFVYDTIRQAWTKFDSWNPVDFAITNNNVFLILSANDGNIYQAFSGYTDNSNPYNAYYNTKLNLLGNAFTVKTLDAIYVEGYMTQSTKLYADVLFNEKGRLFKATYLLTYGVQGFQFSNVIVGGLAQFPFNQNINDSLTPDQIQNYGYFRGYLSVPVSYGLFAVQIKFYSKDANSVWFLTGWGTKPTYEESLPALMRIDANSPVNYFSQALPPGTSITTPNGQSFKIETPTGVTDGVNTVFTVLNTPKIVVLNGLTLFQGDGYTLSGLTITLTVPPAIGSTLRTLY